jgi:hypothetical protein
MTHTYPSATERSVLAILRSVIPQRALHSFEEAKRIAELQASRLLELHGIGAGPVPTEMIAQLPKIEIEPVEVSVSGASFWNGRAWIIQLNRYESPARQRFTLAHEYKHIIDHNAADRLYPGPRDSATERAEQAADYFAGCLLVPKKLLKRAYYGGMQRPSDLAEFFQVSQPAILVRLRQTGITDPTPRCAPSSAPFSRSWRYGLNHGSHMQGV